MHIKPKSVNKGSRTAKEKKWKRESNIVVRKESHYQAHVFRDFEYLFQSKKCFFIENISKQVNI